MTTRFVISDAFDMQMMDKRRGIASLALKFIAKFASTVVLQSPYATTDLVEKAFSCIIFLPRPAFSSP